MGTLLNIYVLSKLMSSVIEVIFLFGFAFSILFSTAHGQMYFPELRFQKFFGTPLHDKAIALVVGLDSNLYLGGITQGKNAMECTNGYLLKVSPEGNLLWSKILDGTGCDEVRGLASSPDSTILFCGIAGSTFKHPEFSDTLETADYLVGKIDYDGNLIWKKIIGGSYQDIANGVVASPYGGTVTVGSTWSKDFDASSQHLGSNDAWLTIVSKNGDLIRELKLGGKKNDWANHITKTKDGGYILVGFTNSEDLDQSQGRVNGDAWIAKLDFAGSKIWERILKESYEDHLYKVVENTYGFIYACGTSFVEGKGYQFWLVKLDALGNPLFNRKWGDSGHEVLTSLYPTSDGGLILTGYSYYENLENPYIKGGYDCWVIRTDGFGDILWQKTYGGPTYEKGIDIIEYKPHEFFVLAEKHNHFEKNTPSKENDFWLISVHETDCDLVKPMFTMDIKNNFEKMDVPIRFQNQSNYGERYLWDFGDGTYSTEKNPIKSYKLPGFYYITLTVFVNENCYKSYKYPNYITVM